MATNDDNNFNPLRRLCPDGSCIGVIGSDGKCSVCGLSDAGTASDGSTAPSGEKESWDAGADDAPDADGDASSREDGATAFDPSRRLCPDDTCIGVIGKDNRCSVCRRPAGD